MRTMWVWSAGRGLRTMCGVITISSVEELFWVSLLLMLFRPGISLKPGFPLMARLSFLSISLATTMAWFCGMVTTPAQARFASTGLPLMDEPARAEIFISIFRAMSPERMIDGVALSVRPRSSYWIMGMVGVAAPPSSPRIEFRLPVVPGKLIPGIPESPAPRLEYEDVWMG